MFKSKQRQKIIFRFLFITVSLIFTALLLPGCRQSVNLDEPPEILYGQDVCEECGMIISEERFAAAYVTKAGNVFRFDDIGGMLLYDQKNQADVQIYWVHDLETKAWLNVNNAYFVLSDELATPMGWGLAAFTTQKQAEAYLSENGGVLADFETLQQEIADGTLDPTTLSTHHHEGELDHDIDMDDE